jgi:hypothetical protein
MKNVIKKMKAIGHLLTAAVFSWLSYKQFSISMYNLPVAKVVTLLNQDCILSKTNGVT